MAQDFVTFGRTSIFFINDDYDIESGIVDIIQPVNPGGDSDPEDVFVVKRKRKDTPNEYYHTNLVRRDIRFDKEAAKDMLIAVLKDMLINNSGE